MAKKKKNIKVITIILLIALGIYLVNYFGIFDRGSNFLTLAPIEGGCSNPNELCEIEYNSQLTCPFDVDFCKVQGLVDCTQQEPGKTVIFRTNAINSNDYNNAGKWLAMKYIPSGTSLVSSSNLLGYCQTSTIISSLTPNSQLAPFNTQISVYNSNLYINTNGNWRRYSSCSLSSSYLQSSPLEPFTSNNQEISIGGYSYDCSWSFEARDSSGNLINDQLSQIYQNDNQPGIDLSTNVFTLPGGGIAKFLGNNFQNPRIKYNKLLDITGCSVNYCQGDVKIECVNGKPGNSTLCQYGCKSGVCSPPYQSLVVNFLDGSNFQKNSFARGEPFRIKTNIVSQTPLSGQIKLDIHEDTVQGAIVFTDTQPFNSGINNYFSIDNGLDFTGDYYVIMTINYGLSEPIIIGQNGEYKFSVQESFTANLRASQKYGGVDNSNLGYTNYPIKIEYIFKELGGQPTLPTSAYVTYSIDNGQEIELTNPQSSSGTYTYYLTPTIQGTYKFTGTATKNAFTTNPSVANFEVQPDVVVINYHLSTNPVIINKLYTDLITFTTKNKNGELVNSNSTVTVKINGVSSGTIPVKGTNGQYSIDYTFLKDNADYTIIIDSSSSNLVSSSVSSPLIKSGSVETKKCDENSCSLFQTCNQDTGNCDSNINLILIYLSGFAGIIILIVIILRVRKSRSPNFGGDIKLS